MRRIVQSGGGQSEEDDCEDPLIHVNSRKQNQIRRQHFEQLCSANSLTRAAYKTARITGNRKAMAVNAMDGGGLRLCIDQSTVVVVAVVVVVRWRVYVGGWCYWVLGERSP